MVGEEIFSAAQRPENLQNLSQPSQNSLVIDRITRCQPVSDAHERLVEKLKEPVGSSPVGGSSGEAWRDRAPD